MVDKNSLKKHEKAIATIDQKLDIIQTNLDEYQTTTKKCLQQLDDKLTLIFQSHQELNKQIGDLEDIKANISLLLNQLTTMKNEKDKTMSYEMREGSTATHDHHMGTIKPSKGDDDSIATEEVKDEIFCCLYDGEGVVLTCISTDITAEEVQKQSRRVKSPPSNKTLDSSFGSCRCDYGTTLVSVGSIVYCIGGISEVDENGNQVTMFDTNKTSLELVTCPSMNMGRTFPAVVVIDKKIYAFGQISDKSDDAIQTPWAECLDTNMPIHKQKWEPLTQPPSLLKDVFAIHYEDSTISVGSSGTCCMESYILIGCSSNHDALLYGVNSGVWKICSFGDTIDYASNIFAPVTVGCEKTMYWVCRRFIYAYDLVDNIVYMANIEDSALYDHNGGFDTLYMGPDLMHLKDNIFCCFTVYYLEPVTTLRPHIVVECTKFRITKEKEPKDEGSKSETGVLHLHSVGYESYLSPALSGVLGVLPM